MAESKNVNLPDRPWTESFEFIIGLAEQRCMVLHPGRTCPGFVKDGAAMRHPNAERTSSAGHQRPA